MKLFRLLLFFIFYRLLANGSAIYGQTITVPNKISFANMQLYIAAEAKEEIQKKVTSLTRSPKHYKEVFDRINLYMPLIERVLKEEGLPDDLKYLAIQESHLISDDISETNAVGFWQFKQAGALEVGTRIDRYIDERMHIVASTRAFAKYIKKHYSHFNNWLYSLLAFHLGRGGAKTFIKEHKWNIGATTATIDNHAHWYIYHFIAHKLVFKDVIGKELHPELYLYECRDCQGKTIHELSQQFGVALPMIRSYNKWLKPTKIPEDATCSVLIPMTHQQYAQLDHLRVYSLLDKYKINYSAYWDKAQNFPCITSAKSTTKSQPTIQINGINGIVAQPNDNLTTLATKGNITLKQFLEFNDIDAKHQIEIGQAYYFKAKNSRANVHYHIVRHKETWWSIAQKYGIKLSSLLSKNRARKALPLTAGRVLWLRFMRPANIPIAYLNDPIINNAPSKPDVAQNYVVTENTTPYFKKGSNN
ncbi:MAG: lytic transglycosylase domain-containing protein [Candidatus Amoebophilus sp.]